MAKRRKLEAPSADDLTKLEQEFRRETPPVNPALAPIAQVAAESASAAPQASSETREKLAAADKAAADLKAAQAAGLIIQEIPLEEIAADVMIRDRTFLDEAELIELRLSIAANGLRLPIEVYEMEGEGPERYGLISGYRRFKAFQDLLELSNQDKYKTIKALIRPRQDLRQGFAAMVEENEVRSALSPFERGRIAAIAAGQGVFTNTEEAVNTLFATASKAKRSKVRSFAQVFDELGDVLNFAEKLTERQGLRLATALRHGAERALREVLDTGNGVTAEEEWALIEPVIEDTEAAPKHVRRGGRPNIGAPKPGWHGDDTLHLTSGITLRRETDGKDYLIRFQGKKITPSTMELIMTELRHLLESK